MSKDGMGKALGLCRRAGKITAGTGLVREKIRAGKAALVLLASDAAKNTEDKILPLAQKEKIPVERISLTKAEIGRAIGRNADTVCVCIPEDFVDLVRTQLESHLEGFYGRNS